jgi:hypothetical protein
MVSTFREKLTFGQIGESLIARYLRLQGWTILPAYEKEIDNGKGPRLFLPLWAEDAELITPDLQAIKMQQVKWIEAKHKNMATFFRKKWRWQTGIDKHHYLDYLKVQDRTPTWPIWLLFLQEVPLETNAPPGVEKCPTGLFGCPITQPFADEGSYYNYEKRRSYDMVYWGLSDGPCHPKDLKRLATLEDVLDASKDIE